MQITTDPYFSAKPTIGNGQSYLRPVAIKEHSTDSGIGMEKSTSVRSTRHGARRSRRPRLNIHLATPRLTPNNLSRLYPYKYVEKHERCARHWLNAIATYLRVVA